MDGLVVFFEVCFDLDAVAQQLVGAQVGLVKGDAGGIGGGFELF